MSKIFMTCLERTNKRQEATLGIFLKGQAEHMNELMAFLDCQNFTCRRMPEERRRAMQEFAYFDDAFTFSARLDRWGFFEIKDYIQAYCNTWEDDVFLRESIVKELRTCDEDLVFDDTFYCQLAKKVDHCEDRYYQTDMNIACFLSGILKLLCDNLQLYWGAGRLLHPSIRTWDEPITWPSSTPRKAFMKAFGHTCPRGVIRSPVEFDKQLIAEIAMRPGPFSPKQSVIRRFIGEVVGQIDDFIYGHLLHGEQINALNAKLAERTGPTDPGPAIPAVESQVLGRRKLMIIGALKPSADAVRAACETAGFKRDRVTLRGDYAKLKNLDATELLVEKCGYDALIFGPMPHSIKGKPGDASSLIEDVSKRPDRYPPFAVARDKSGELKITHDSLRRALKEVTEKMAGQGGGFSLGSLVCSK